MVREAKQDPPPDPELPRRLSGDIATLVQPRPETDWQTITTDHFAEPNRESIGSDGLGIVDIGQNSDETSGASTRFSPFSSTSTGRIIQHVHEKDHDPSQQIRKSQRFKISKTNTNATGFSPIASRRIIQSPVRAVDAIRRVSNSIFRESQSPQPHLQSAVLQVWERSNSYESLDSRVSAEKILVTSAGSGEKDTNKQFRWSRIRENLGRDMPKQPLTIFDQPLYSPGLLLSQKQCKVTQRVPHDNFLSQIPQLHFPLISLPEAAMLQHFRRERGEEDHTMSACSARGSLNTISSTAKSCTRQSPTSSNYNNGFGFPGSPVARPSTVHHGNRHKDIMRSSTECK